MMAIRPFKEQIEEAYPTLDAANLPMILDQFRNFMNE